MKDVTSRRHLSGGDAATHREIALSQFNEALREAQAALSQAVEWGGASPDTSEKERDRAQKALAEVDGLLRSLTSPERLRERSIGDGPDRSQERTEPVRVVQLKDDMLDTGDSLYP